MHVRRLLALACLGLSFAVAPLPAHAAQLDIQPLGISLARGTSSGAITVENNGAEPVRLQIQGFAWEEAGKDDIKLTPTDDLIVFPSLVTLAPGERRSVRVGCTAKAGPVEKDYRVQLVELGAPTTEAMTVHLMSHITLPVFLPPLSPVAKAEVGDVISRAKSIDVSLMNPGNVHFVVRSVRVVAKDRAGATVAAGEVKGWYVLPQMTRTYSVTTAGGVCGQITSATLDIDTDGGPIHRTEAVRSECGG